MMHAFEAVFREGSIVVYAIVTLSACAASVPQVPAGPRVAAAVVAEDPEDHYHVTLAAADDSRQSCTTPCELEVASGTAHVSISGDAEFKQDVVLVPDTSRVVVRRALSGVRLTGQILGGIGLAGAEPATSESRATVVFSPLRAAATEVALPGTGNNVVDADVHHGGATANVAHEFPGGIQVRPTRIVHTRGMGSSVTPLQTLDQPPLVLT